MNHGCLVCVNCNIEIDGEEVTKLECLKNRKDFMKQFVSGDAIDCDEWEEKTE